MFARNKIAAVVLSLVDYPLHYDQDLNYIAEVVRGIKSPSTPWQSLRSELGKYIFLFKLIDSGRYDLAQSSPTRKQFVISKIGHLEYNQIIDALKYNHFLDENGKLTWIPHPHYRHLASTQTSVQHIQPKQIIQEKNDLANKGFLDQLKYVLAAYALKGDMSISEVTDYLHNTIHFLQKVLLFELQYQTRYDLACR